MTGLLLRDCRFVIVDPTTILEKTSILIDDGLIAGVGDAVALLGDETPDQEIDARNKLVMPGLVDCHTHLGQPHLFALDGLDQMRRWGGHERHISPLHELPIEPLSREFYLYLWPAYAWLDADRTRDLLRLGHLNAIKHGTTTVSDAFIFPDVMGTVAEESGLRVDMALQLVSAVELRDCAGPEECLQVAENAFARWHGEANGRITCRVHPHTIYSCEEWFLRECVALADRRDLCIGTHIAESQMEVEAAEAVWPGGVVRRAYDLGLMGPRSLFYHACRLSDHDISLFVETGTSVAHCPLTNTNTMAWIAPVPDLVEAGVTVGLGSDMSNSDMFYAMKYAWGVHHVNPERRMSIAPWQPLEFATKGSAAALGMGHKIGTIEAGKAADVVTVDLLRNSRLVELDPVSTAWALALKGSGDDVQDVIVDGTVLMRDRVIPHLDEQEIVGRARATLEQFNRDYLHMEGSGEPFVNVLHEMFPP